MKKSLYQFRRDDNMKECKCAYHARTRIDRQSTCFRWPSDRQGSGGFQACWRAYATVQSPEPAFSKNIKEHGVHDVWSQTAPRESVAQGKAGQEHELTLKWRRGAWPAKTLG
jgi:hypothetical protein